MSDSIYSKYFILLVFVALIYGIIIGFFLHIGFNDLMPSVLNQANNYLAIFIVTLITILISAFVVGNALKIYLENSNNFIRELDRLKDILLQFPTKSVKLFQIDEIFKQKLEKRNDFFQTYCQTILAIFVVFIITILLLTRTITAEAGLPIITGIVAFIIGKANSQIKDNRHNPVDPVGQNPDNPNPVRQNPENPNPDGQNPENPNPDGQNPEEQKKKNGIK